MGLKPVLFFIPIAIMLVAIAIETGIGAVQGQGSVCVNQQGSTTCTTVAQGTNFTVNNVCSPAPQLSGVPAGDLYVVACNNSLGIGANNEVEVLFAYNSWANAFVIGPGQASIVDCNDIQFPSGSSCTVYIAPCVTACGGVNPSFQGITFGPGFWATCGGGIGLLRTGLTCTTTSTFTQTQSSAGSGLFAFIAQVGTDSNGWVNMIILAIGITVVGGLAILGSGLNAESTHIMFVGGSMAAVWLILTAIEGYPGAKEQFFNGINSLLSGAGPAVYLLVTMVYAASVITAVSRGV